MARQAGSTGEKVSGRRQKLGPSVSAVAEFLEYLSPPVLSSPEQPFGLQVGDPDARIRTTVVAAMPTFTAISTAAARPSSLLVTAAPLITKPLSSICRNDPVGDRVSRLIERRVNLYVLPNSFAAAPGGFDDSLAERLGLAATRVLLPTAHEELLKIAVFTPLQAVDAVLNAAAEAGAGHIGNYSHCSFQVQGAGTFLPRPGANPTIGTVGQLEQTPEVRIEMIAPARELKNVLAAILDVHPYEEVAYDIYPLRNPGTAYGRGRIGELPLEVSLDTIVYQAQDVLPGCSVRCSHRTDISITRLAVVSGSCESLASMASTAGAGAVLTGQATPTDWMFTENSGTVLIEVGYSASLAPGLERLAAQIRKTFGSEGVEVICCT